MIKWENSPFFCCLSGSTQANTVTSLTTLTDMESGESIVSWTESKSCPTYRSIDGLQKAITNSFQWVTIPSPTFSGLANQWHSCGDKLWPQRRWHRVLQQTALEQLLLGAQKCITLSMLLWQNQRQSFHDPRCHTGVCRELIYYQVLPVVKDEHKWW